MQPLIFASCRVSPQFSQKSTGVTAGAGWTGATKDGLVVTRGDALIGERGSGTADIMR